MIWSLSFAFQSPNTGVVNGCDFNWSVSYTRELSRLSYFECLNMFCTVFQGWLIYLYRIFHRKHGKLSDFKSENKQGPRKKKWWELLQTKCNIYYFTLMLICPIWPTACLHSGIKIRKIYLFFKYVRGWFNIRNQPSLSLLTNCLSFFQKTSST